MKNRGVLTDSVKVIADEFLKREIGIKELRLYPFLDYCLKNSFEWNLGKINREEMAILDKLQEEKHILYSVSFFRCTREFYDYIQCILAESYVPDFVTKDELMLLN